MTESGLIFLKQRMPAAARRIQLLEVALDCFAAQGYHETSMEVIAETAGVTKPVLYQHFHSKQDLFLELLDTVGQQLLDTVSERVAAQADPYQKLLAGFRTYFDFVCERTSAFQIVFGGSARLTEEFSESVRRIEAGMAATISAHINADLDDEHRDLLGYAIVGLGEVAGRRWVTLHEDAERPGAAQREDEAAVLAERLANLMWAGLRGLPGSPSSRPGTEG